MAPAVIKGTIIISILPLVLTMFGADFGNHAMAPDLTEPARELAGVLTHTILEWSAVCTAIFTFIPALCRLHGRLSYPGGRPSDQRRRRQP